MFDITLLRHGESEGNRAGWIQGQTNSSLTAKGRFQAHSLAEYWFKMGIKFDLVICSSLARAQETASIISETIQVPLETDSLWQERGFGEIEGHSAEEMVLLQPDLDFYHPYIAPASGAECQLDLFIRASQAVKSLLLRQEGRYLVVSHGAILNMVLYTIFGLTPQGNYQSPRFMFDNTGYAQLTYKVENRQWRLWNFNCTPHLDQGVDLA
jgi:2,3-bisphosphoglycerate-dependent phosphoglycerate mutase